MKLHLSLLALALTVGCSGSSSKSSGTTVAATTSSSSGASTSSVGSGTVSTTPSALPPNWNLIAFESVERGSSSPRGFTTGAHETHVASDADWAMFWPTHRPTALPTVDFTQDSVVGAFMAPLMGSTNTTQIVNVSRDTNSDDLQALVREFHRGTWNPPVRVQTTAFDLVRCATSVSGLGSLSVIRQAELDSETIAAGTNNAIGAGNPAYAGGLEVFRDSAAFSAFYAQLQPGLRPPAVDFQTEMVVAVLGPYIPRFGNSIETQRLVHDPITNRIRVLFRVNPYRGGAAPPPATETPFQVLRVTRAPGAISPEVVTPLTLAQPSQGLSRGHTGPAETRLVRDATSFTALWTAKVGGTPPVVDFAIDQVVITFTQPASTNSATVARAVLLEDHELSVTVNTLLTAPVRDSRYSMALTPRSLGPLKVETVDVTPRP